MGSLWCMCVCDIVGSAGSKSGADAVQLCYCITCYQRRYTHHLNERSGKCTEQGTQHWTAGDWTISPRTQKCQLVTMSYAPGAGHMHKNVLVDAETSGYVGTNKSETNQQS